MNKIGQMLRPALGRDEVLRTGRALKILRDWSKIVGEAMATRSIPDRYHKGIVWVAVEGSSWAQELRMQKEQILEKLQEKSPEVGLFLNIRFGVRPIKASTAVVEILPAKEKSKPSDEVRQLTIKEIAERRLKNWPDGGNTS